MWGSLREGRRGRLERPGPRLATVAFALPGRNEGEKPGIPGWGGRRTRAAGRTATQLLEAVVSAEERLGDLIPIASTQRQESADAPAAGWPPRAARESNSRSRSTGPVTVPL